jgi:hypothetical protein
VWVAILFTPRSLAALGNQFVNQRRSRRNAFAYQLLGFGQATPQRGDSQLIVFDAQNNSAARLDTEGAAKRSRDKNSPAFVNAGTVASHRCRLTAALDFVDSTHTEGAPSLRFLQGWELMKHARKAPLGGGYSAYGGVALSISPTTYSPGSTSVRSRSLRKRTKLIPNRVRSYQVLPNLSFRCRRSTIRRCVCAGVPLASTTTTRCGSLAAIAR